ncbi:heterokaryon incompatibility protein-domain-containing protein [Hyaloscypha sp. PMI_1271]|nr:heterokaryon incompatibility protein-domain-containing protein [Hyaloscypha sp. PMI_1271]
MERSDRLENVFVAFTMFIYSSVDGTTFIRIYYTKEHAAQFEAIPLQQRKTMGIQPNTDSSQSFQCFRSWLSDCNSTDHPNCFKHKPQIATSLPTRLLHVLDSTKTQVMMTSGLPKSTQYMTLSHCWGEVKPMVLTKATSSILFSPFETKILPKTFQDAVRITCEVGLSYIWIDSLCIFQDNPADWERESHTMADVYSQSYCNIAAASARDSSEGCFFDRAKEACFPRTIEPSGEGFSKIYELYPERLWADGVSIQPLLQRGWVLQEVLLAPRIIYYTRTQLFWKRSHLRACELSPTGIPRLCKDSWATETNLFCEKWQRIVELYSELGLTMERDKLPALDGVAEHERRGGSAGRYLAGLWENFFLQQLVWHRDIFKKPSRPQIDRGPSWSWASMEGKIHYNQPESKDLVGNLRLLDAGVKPDLVDGCPRWFVQLEAAFFLDVSKSKSYAAFLLDLSKSKSYADYLLDLSKLERSNGNEQYAMYLFDDEIACTTDKGCVSTSQHGIIYALVIGVASWRSTSALASMLIVPTGRAKGEFRRVGYLQLEPGDMFKRCAIGSTKPRRVWMDWIMQKEYSLPFDHYEEKKRLQLDIGEWINTFTITII